MQLNHLIEYCYLAYWFEVHYYDCHRDVKKMDDHLALAPVGVVLIDVHHPEESDFIEDVTHFVGEILENVDFVNELHPLLPFQKK